VNEETETTTMPTDSQMADIDAQSGDYQQSFLPPMGDIEIQMLYHDDEFGISRPVPLPGDDDLDNETFDSPCGACQGVQPPIPPGGGGGLLGTTRRPNAAGGKGATVPESARPNPQLLPKPTKAQRKAKRKAACEVEKLTRVDSQRIRKWKFRTVFVALGLGLIAALSLYFVVDQQDGANTSELTVLVADNRDEATRMLLRQLENMGEEMAQLVAATALTTNASLPNVTVDLWEEQAAQYRDEFPFVEWIGWTAMNGETNDGPYAWQESPSTLHGADVSTILTPTVLEQVRDAAVESQGGAYRNVHNRASCCF
jgi:hypothetical protein